MSKYRVGQLVRVVRSGTPWNTHLIGQEAVICEATVMRFRGRLTDCYGLDICPIKLLPDEQIEGWLDDELEPIVPMDKRAAEDAVTDLLDRCKHAEGVPA